MAQRHTLSLILPSVIIYTAYIAWRRRRNIRDEPYLLKLYTQSAPLLNMNDEKLQLQLCNQASKRGSSVLASSASAVVPFDAQVGGISAHKKTFLSIKPGCVLKPLRLDQRKVREIGFYELVNYPPSLPMKLTDQPSQEFVNQMDQLPSLFPFIPRYYGTVKFDRGQSNATSNRHEEDAEYMILEDLTRSFDSPCIIDVKMGTQSFEPDATAEKKRKEVEKYPQQADFGLRIVAMRLYDPSNVMADSNGYKYYSKHFGRSLNSKSKLKDAFRAFFGIRPTRESIISLVLPQLEEINSWFLKNDSFCFYSSSIMIVYEGNDKCEEPSSPTVKMIDFARVRRKKGGDVGYLVGLKTLATLLQEIEAERSSPASI